MALDTEYDPPASLPPLVRALLRTTHDRHVDMTNLVSGLPPAALEWRFEPDAAPLVGLCLHILDVEEHVARVLTGGDEAWAGENGSRMNERATAEELVAEVERVDALIKQAIEHADPASLPEDLVNELDHCALHLGQMQLTRHLLDAREPDAQRTYVHWR
jgi:hypothetical protein